MENNPSTDEESAYSRYELPSNQNTPEMITSHVQLPPIDSLIRTYQYSNQSQQYNVLRPVAIASSTPSYAEFRGDYYRPGSFSAPEPTFPILQPSDHPIQNFYSDNYHQNPITNSVMSTPYEPYPQLQRYPYYGRNTEHLTNFAVPQHEQLARYYYNNNNLQRGAWLNSSYMSSASTSEPVMVSGSTAYNAMNDRSGYYNRDSTTVLGASNTTDSVRNNPFSSILPSSDDANGVHKSANDFRQPTFGSLVASNLGVASGTSSAAANRAVAIISPYLRISPCAVTDTKKTITRSPAKSSTIRKMITPKKPVGSKSRKKSAHQQSTSEPGPPPLESTTAADSQSPYRPSADIRPVSSPLYDQYRDQYWTHHTNSRGATESDWTDIFKSIITPKWTNFISDTTQTVEMPVQNTDDNSEISNSLGLKFLTE